MVMQRGEKWIFREAAVDGVSAEDLAGKLELDLPDVGTAQGVRLKVRLDIDQQSGKVAIAGFRPGDRGYIDFTNDEARTEHWRGELNFLRTYVREKIAESVKMRKAAREMVREAMEHLDAMQRERQWVADLYWRTTSAAAGVLELGKDQTCAEGDDCLAA